MFSSKRHLVLTGHTNQRRRDGEGWEWGGWGGGLLLNGWVLVKGEALVVFVQDTHESSRFLSPERAAHAARKALQEAIHELGKQPSADSGAG